MDSGLTEYKAALDALFARTGSTAKFGLERTRQFLDSLGSPERRFPALHIAGTNGKGSVVAMLSALLEARGYRVGRYMSPHLVDFRERIAVDGRAIPEEYVLDFLHRRAAAAEALGATFFEITTAMALNYFADCKVDVAVIETGLGGRLDSTNVIDPLVAGITSIGLDHQEYLGDTLASIAREKAGIFKRGRAGVIGALPEEARHAVYETAEAAGASVIGATTAYGISDVAVDLLGTEFTIEHGRESRRIRTGLIGFAQAGNAAVALAMLDAAGPHWSVTLDLAANTLPGVTLPGRFQRVRNMVLDVAHNAHGIRALVETFQSATHETGVTAVLGVLADKDWRAMVLELSRIASRIVLVLPPSAPAARAWNPEEARRFAADRGIDAVVEHNFESAIREAADARETCVVTGSFHTVGDALVVLGEEPL